MTKRDPHQEWAMTNPASRPLLTETATPAPTPRPRRGWLAAGACGLVLAAAAGLFAVMTDARGTAPAAVADGLRLPVVTVVAAQRRPIERVLSLTGTVVPREEIAISAAVDGQRIAEVLVEEGDRVAAGQVILRLETDLLTAALHDAEAAVLRAEAGLARDQAMQVEAAANFQRSEKLRSSSAFNPQDYDKRHAAAISADKVLEVSRAELAQAQAKVDEARARLGRAEIRAPTAGIVAERAARAGAMAGSEPLVKLMREGEVELEAEVPEADLPALAVGQSARITVTGFDDAVDGRVRLVAPKADRDSRLGRARITLPADPRLRPGVFGRAAVMVERRNGAVTIPDRAVMQRDDRGDSSVLLVDSGGALSRRVVTVGLRRDGRAEILSGLDLGQRVVLGAGAFLREGDRVTQAAEEEAVR
ncbi:MULTISPECIES: efflux RND transporter periplasmic adaptor subunit [unclassified Inquilinus]|uniref:efflux RND transporter periplasmic adaptor subunit n=1 Tax=unclassified Inquilinus TaxID=2645927 RepID=UPI003F9130B9